MHLLALLIEVVSIKVAGQQIKKPIDIPRPGKKGSKARRPQQRREEPGELRAPPPPPFARDSDSEPSGPQNVAMQKGIGVLKQTARRR